jgi:hypothetical protein
MRRNSRRIKPSLNSPLMLKKRLESVTQDPEGDLVGKEMLVIRRAPPDSVSTVTRRAILKLTPMKT